MKTESAWVILKLAPYFQDLSIKNTLDFMGSIQVFSSKDQATRYMDNFILADCRENFKAVEVEITIKESQSGS